MALSLSLAACDYDRTRAVFDGRAPVEGCDVTAVALEPEEAFHRAFKFQEFDVSEISMSSYIMTTARGDASRQHRENPLQRVGATPAHDVTSE